MLDYRFYEANAELLLTLQDALGKTREVRIKKGEGRRNRAGFQRPI